MYFFCQLCNYPLLTERAEPWKLVADTRVTGSKDLVASSSASGGNILRIRDKSIPFKQVFWRKNLEANQKEKQHGIQVRESEKR